jgi:hypothetical protein
VSGYFRPYDFDKIVVPTNQPKDESIATQASGIPLTVQGGNATVSALGTLGGTYSNSLSLQVRVYYYYIEALNHLLHLIQ